MLQNKQRISIFDILKGICILFVVITHFSWGGEYRLQFGFPFYIVMAVPIFLLISGYVGCLSFNKKNYKHLEDYYNKNEILKKIFRFLIPFIIFYILDFVFYIVMQTLKHGEYSIIELILNFFAGGHGPGSYYIPILIQFIFVFPIIYWIIKNHKHGYLILFLINFMYEIIKFPFNINEQTYRLLIFRYIFVIASGCYICKNRDMILKNKKELVKMCLMFIIGLTFIIFTSYFNYNSIVFNFWTSTSLISCLYIIPIFYLIILIFKNAKQTFLEYIGKCSFHIFLTQMFYYSYCKDILIKFISSRIILLILGVVICILSGIIFYQLDQKIFSKYFNKLFIQKKESV